MNSSTTLTDDITQGHNLCSFGKNQVGIFDAHIRHGLPSARNQSFDIFTEGSEVICNLRFNNGRELWIIVDP